tara:strand:+ start:27336 stop:28529 length:1194 start_codon:yes stop_codon:yes gene_type:complete
MPLLIHEGSVFQAVDKGLFQSYQKIEAVESEPLTRWNGGKITLEQWEDVKNICAHTFKEHKSECMIRLYYSPESSKWLFMFYPQKMTFMTVKDDFESDMLTEASNGDNFIEAGSVHHHCSTGAFQSSTDHTDEIGCNGLHVTLGKMDDDMYDIHTRFCDSKEFFTPSILSFFEAPAWLEEIPQPWYSDVKYRVMSELIKKAGDPDKARKDWVKNIIPKTTATVPAGSPGYGYGYASHHTDRYTYQTELDAVVGPMSIPERTATKEEVASEINNYYENIVSDEISNILLDTDDTVTKSLGSDEYLSYIVQAIQLSKKGAEDHAMPFMSALHENIRMSISDLRDEFKDEKNKPPINLTEFGKWIKDKPLVASNSAMLAIADHAETAGIDKESNMVHPIF